MQPANIFLTTDGTIKVGDLGLSREMSDETVQAFSKVGTPLYMSPEVLKGDGYDFKSDIWSMGCLLYEVRRVIPQRKDRTVLHRTCSLRLLPPAVQLAMLKSPFKSEGLNLYLLFQKISRADYQPVSEEYSAELRDLVVEMLNTTAGNRPDINYVCDIARRMRDRTAQEYLRQKRSVRQDSSKDAGRGESTPAPTTTSKAIATAQNGMLAAYPTSDPAPNGAKLNGQHEPRHFPDRTSEQHDRQRSSTQQQVQAPDVQAAQTNAGEATIASADQFQAMLEMDALHDMLQELGYSSASSTTATDLPHMNNLYFVFEAQAYNTPARPQVRTQHACVSCFRWHDDD
jgi:serine/threonine protein kinase